MGLQGNEVEDAMNNNHEFTRHFMYGIQLVREASCSTNQILVESRLVLADEVLKYLDRFDRSSSAGILEHKVLQFAIAEVRKKF